MFLIILLVFETVLRMQGQKNRIVFLLVQYSSYALGTCYIFFKVFLKFYDFFVLQGVSGIF